MAALPYIPLYVADYLADTSHLSTLEHGAYMLLIMNYWQRGSALPANDVQLARIARVTLKEWSSIRLSVADFFEDVDGQWVHGRIEQELEKVRAKSQQASNAGKASVQRKFNVRSTPVEHPLNHTDTDTDTERRKKEPTVLSKEKRGSRVPDDFEPDQTCQNLAHQLGLSNEDVNDSKANFLDYWRAVPAAKGVKLDWQATFRNQLRHISKQRGNPHGRQEKPGGKSREELLRILRA